MIDESTVSPILKHYGICETSIEWVRPLARGTKNASARVRADGRDWALKRHTSAQAIRRLELAHELEVRLMAAGLPVAPLQHTDHGHTLVALGTAHYSLHAWVTGQQATIGHRDRVIARRPGLLAEVASTLAAMHQIATPLAHTTLGPPRTSTSGRLHGPHHVVRSIQRRRRTGISHWSALRLKPRKSGFDRWILQEFPTIIRHAKALAQHSSTSTLDEVECIVIHNDVNWENLVLGEDFEIRALLDFDNVTREPREFEIGAAAVVIAGTAPGRTEQLLTAYEESAQVKLDRSAVDLAMKYKCLKSLTHSVAVYLRGETRDVALLESWCRQLYASLQDLEHQ